MVAQRLTRTRVRQGPTLLAGRRALPVFLVAGALLSRPDVVVVGRVGQHRLRFRRRPRLGRVGFRTGIPISRFGREKVSDILYNTNSCNKIYRPML